MVQTTTAAILFWRPTRRSPVSRFASLLARDRFRRAPSRQPWGSVGLSNGVIRAGHILRVPGLGFEAIPRLIPLYAVGVFLCPHSLRAGWVVHWWREGKTTASSKAAAASASAEIENHRTAQVFSRQRHRRCDFCRADDFHRDQFVPVPDHSGRIPILVLMFLKIHATMLMSRNSYRWKACRDCGQFTRGIVHLGIHRGVSPRWSMRNRSLLIM